MNIEIVRDVTVGDLVAGYRNLDLDGVYAYSGKLEVRPPYQREFCYDQSKQVAVIDSVMHKYPLGLMYFCRKEDGTLECLDGQQRIISLCEFTKNRTIINVDGNSRNYQSLLESNSDLIEAFLAQPLIIAICEGTNEEKLDWFERINTVGEPLTHQELRNAIYTGPWVTDAKRYFSHEKCAAWHRTEKTYGAIFGNSLSRIRQEWLEQVILWKCEWDGQQTSDKDKAIKDYMVAHQHLDDAEDLTAYFEDMVDWIKRNFKYKKLMEKVDWGHLYNLYHDVDLKKSETDAYIDELIANAKKDGITNPKGIYEYVFDGELRHLSDRAFPAEIKRTRWDLQGHKCALCAEDLALEDAAGDHIYPWSQGGTTTIDNCQCLCVACNTKKAAKLTKEAKERADALRLSGK